ncbi:1708_t:CDS:10 [Funneliformis geosporum]|uniref:DNA-directed RNA polymerase n=1 Tax=Funneliformis geosporum TaxID=1117311 RepID=A0A9W4WN78_9GLOM|nr:1708_t:CDS:10 [Funneliformis geosporum]
MPSTFNTLERENLFLNPSSDKFGYPELQKLVKPHIESFNSLLEPAGKGILHLAIDDIGAQEIFDVPKNSSESGNKLTIWIDDVMIAKPLLSENVRLAKSRQIYPTECRERLTTYAGKMTAKFCWQVNDGPVNVEAKYMGMIPVMVKSNRCNLYNLYSRQLIQHHEESEEMGGYFIVNGIEKIIRLLLIPRRNHMMALIRPSFANRGEDYTEYGVQIRCAKLDQSTVTNTLHYLKNGSCMIRFSWKKQEFMVPVILVMKSLVEVSDKGIYDMLVQGEHTNTFLTDRVELMLHNFKLFSVQSREQCTSLLGEKFRITFSPPTYYTNKQVGDLILNKVILVHLRSKKDKFNLFAFMIRKLYSLVAGECCQDNPDSQQNQEILLGGYLYGMIIKEKLFDVLNGFRTIVSMDINAKRKVNFNETKYMNHLFAKVNHDIGQKLSYFLATGNLVSNTGLDLMQTTGYTIVAEKLNFYRFISHFRCVHRGSFFTTLKTTTVRKLLPESWGFLCPVHTPDGTPCGLLNHLSHTCRVVTERLKVDKIPEILAEIGVSKNVTTEVSSDGSSICVQLDGKIIGWCDGEQAKAITNELRKRKFDKTNPVPLDLEIGYVPPSNGGQYPGIYLFSSPSRMMRPVKYLFNNKTDMVGSYEQVYMDIACLDEDVIKGVSTHQEFAPTNILSILANLTPFSDYNQSPRNMYQCQMAKQTMGTPATSLRYRTDNKLYRLQTGQTPIVRPELHNILGLDGFPNGTNAIVAVISYTGYDMEDAMIINKSSHERGFAYGTIYKSEVVDLGDYRSRGEPIKFHFGFEKDAPPAWREKLDNDGFPFIGIKLTNGDPLCAYYDDTTKVTKSKNYKGLEDAYVEEIRLIGDDAGKDEVQKIHIKLRIPRPPVIGDKFSSRHGQKGILSQLWPQINMPFTESGMQPDIIINPHAFPSRMTIGMFVESLAGKAGALFGVAQDCTPFKFNESDTAIDYFGEQLRRAGYNYHGNEPLYSGVTGEEFKADIYIGVCHLCAKCGTIFTALIVKEHETRNDVKYKKHHIICKVCDTAQYITLIKIPFAFRYLATELASMGVKITLDTKY